MPKKSFIPAARIKILTPLFDILCNLIGLGKSYRNKIIEKLNFNNEKIKVLDAGCGTGTLAIEIKKLNPNIELYGIDADNNILKIAKEKSKKEKINIIYHNGHLQRLPFPDEYFDAIYSSLVFHHLDSNSKEKASKEIYRVLKNRGSFFLIDFGKPRNKTLAILSCFSVIFEEGYDNYKGKIPDILKKANFASVNKLGEYRYNIHFLIAKK